MVFGVCCSFNQQLTRLWRLLGFNTSEQTLKTESSFWEEDKEMEKHKLFVIPFFYWCKNSKPYTVCLASSQKYLITHHHLERQYFTCSIDRFFKRYSSQTLFFVFKNLLLVMKLFFFFFYFNGRLDTILMFCFCMHFETVGSWGVIIKCSRFAQMD